MDRKSYNEPELTDTSAVILWPVTERKQQQQNKNLHKLDRQKKVGNKRYLVCTSEIHTPTRAIYCVQHNPCVSVSVCVCVCVIMLDVDAISPKSTHTQSPITGSIRHPGPQIAQQPAGSSPRDIIVLLVKIFQCAQSDVHGCFPCTEDNICKGLKRRGVKETAAQKFKGKKNKGRTKTYAWEKKR